MVTFIQSSHSFWIQILTNYIISGVAVSGLFKLFARLASMNLLNKGKYLESEFLIVDRICVSTRPGSIWSTITFLVSSSWKTLKKFAKMILKNNKHCIQPGVYSPHLRKYQWCMNPPAPYFYSLLFPLKLTQARINKHKKPWLYSLTQITNLFNWEDWCSIVKK